jgi:hypothetical protein
MDQASHRIPVLNPLTVVLPNPACGLRRTGTYRAKGFQVCHLPATAANQSYWYTAPIRALKSMGI